MILKPCPFCRKDIPRAIHVCPYCHRDEQGKTVAMDSTVEMDRDADKFFDSDLQELASDDAFIREQAVIRVAKRGFGVVQALISILSDFGKPGLAGIARVLGKIGDRRAIPALTQAAKMGDDDLRTAAVWALSQYHEPEVLPTLLSEAQRPHPIVQSYLANVLGTFQDGRVLPVLAGLTKHPNREIAFQAICSLGEMGNRDAIPALQRAWRRRDPLVRAAGAASLRRLGARPKRWPLLSMAAGILLLGMIGAAAGWLLYR